MTHEPVFRGRPAAALLLCALVAVGADAGETLFPSALHLTRRIVDPVAGTDVTVDEYCEGNRVVTLRGERTVIVDHALQQLTEIDRAASTYSITSFDAIARSTALAARNLAQLQGDAATSDGAVTALGRRHAAGGRPVDAFEIADPNLKGQRTQLAIDRSVEISRAALDVLLGAAYPGRPGRHHQAIVTAATATRPRVQSDEATSRKDVAYGLPVEQHEEFDWEGRTLMRSVTVVRIGTETPPPEMLAIPPGARRVEPRFTVMPRALEELDRLPGRGDR